MKQEILTYVLGDMKLSEMIACCAFGFVGILVHTIYKVLKRDPLTPYSPIHFSFKYLISDNFKRILLSILLILIGIPLLIFFSENFLGLTPNLWVSIGIGFGFDSLIKRFIETDVTEIGLTNILDKNETMEFWDLVFNNAADLVETPTVNVNLRTFAGNTKGTLSSATITYTAQPSFASVNAIGQDSKVYVATPTRRPV